MDTPVHVLVLAFVLIAMIVLVVRLRKNRLSLGVKQSLLVIAEHMAVAVLPLAWYFVLSNHSYVHSWFTYKSLVSSSFAAMALMVRLNSVVTQKKLEHMEI